MVSNLHKLIALTFSLFVISAVMIFSGCGGGGRGSVATLPPRAETDELTRISGGVFDSNGQPVAAATVVINAEQVAAKAARVSASGVSQASAVTDEHGTFSFDLSSSPTEGTRIVLRLSKPGYIDTNAVVRLNYSSVDDGLLFLPVRMISTPQDESTATQAEITRTDGTTQIITPETVTDPDTGLTITRTTVTFDEDVEEVTFTLPSPEDTNIDSVAFTIGGAVSGGRTVARTLGYTGEVTGSLYYGDPTDEDALKIFPGEFVTSDDTGTGSAGRAASSGGTEGTLVTAGFTQINLEDSSGDEITSFADGVEVGVTMRVPDGIYNPETGGAVSEGDDVPIFTYDEDSGEWRVEYNADGSVKRGTVMRDDDGLYVPFTTDHLSWFNLDWKGQLCAQGHPTIQAVDGTGQQLTHFSVTTSGNELTGWSARTVTTNDGAVQFMRAPADIQWYVTVESEEYISEPVEIVACSDVTVTLEEILTVSDTTINATCSGSPYSGVDVYVYREGVRIATGETGANGSLSFELPIDTNVMIYGRSGDLCADLESAYLAIGATDVTSSANLSFNNVCCPNYVAPLKISGLTPNRTEGVDTDSSVAGTLQLSKDTIATSVPDLTVTLKQGNTTVFSNVAADTLGTVSWTDENGGNAKTMGLTIAGAEHLVAGKTYSFTIGLTTTQFSATDGGSLELDSYLTSVPGVVSYTSTSVTGTFTTEAGPANQLPIPDAGDDISVLSGTQVTLDGTGSSDPDGDPLTYLWTLATGYPVDITDSDSSTAMFTPAEDGEYLFALTVDDGRGGKMRDLVTVTVCTSISCYSDDECNDDKSYTVDTCVGVGTCDAACANEGTYCSINLDKVNYEPGEQMGITFTASNAGAEDAECGARVLLKRDNEPIVWFSFDDDIYVTIPAGTRVEETKYYAVPEAWADTDSPAGSDYGIYPVSRDGTDWDNGDNFNIKVRKCDESDCSADTDCDDGLAYTTDTCVSPDTCSAECSYDCDAACLNDIDCDDTDALTIDECVDFVSCDPAVACSNIQIACNSDADCDDSVALTDDSCSDPGTVASACSNTPCVAACSADNECDDSDANTLDECSAPGTCDAACANCIPVCENDTQCDDSNPMTDDVCDSVGTCSAACSNSPCTPACSSAADCDDGDPDTPDICVNAGICGAACTTARTQHPVESGGYHTCAIDSSDAVKCWGDNWSGQLGDGTEESSSSPVSVTGLTNVVAVTGGYEHSCAVISNGTVKCWGENWIGQLGDGTEVSTSIPVDVSGLTDAVDVTALAYSSCALISNGTVKCWGYNSMGELGDGSTIDSTIPVDVTGITDAVGLSHHDEGDEFVCALLYSGGVKCWGANWSGMIGDGTYDDTETPVDVSGISDAVNIGGGYNHVCAVLSGGGMQCWGGNWNGQLGDGTEDEALTPVDVVGMTDAVAVSGGGDQTCAIHSGGGVSCWGFGGGGERGDGDYTDIVYTPSSVVGITDAISLTSGYDYSCAMLSGGGIQCWGDNSSGQFGNGSTIMTYTPVDVSGITDAVNISSCAYHVCVTLSGGGVQCWGRNYSGELGNGEDLSSSSPVNASSVSGVNTVTTGSAHTCVLLAGGGVQCWGDNYYDQLGDGTNIDSTTPVDVVLATDTVFLDSGVNHICAVLTDGSVQCWGKGNYGQLGNGSTISSSPPVDVSGVNDATEVSIGMQHSCAIRSGGGVKCWGQGTNSQLGNGLQSNSSTPVDVTGITDAIDITSGSNHTCVLRSGGTMKCWGDNGSGQLGDGTTTDSNTPVDVTGITTAISITAGTFHTCAVLSGGGMQCWGANLYGTLGDEAVTYSSTPLDVTGITDAASVSAGGRHTCALIAGGGVKCWGTNSSGQLGEGSVIFSATPVDVLGF